jgi:hypothetical protein
MPMLSPDDFNDWRGCSTGWTDLPSRDGISEADYFAFAECDLRDGADARHAINAISNAKRALHLRVDRLVDVLGGYRGSLKRKGEFPSKLQFCRDCGLASPRIINRINSTRNRVEHDYLCPSIDEAEDYTDIVSLFLGATSRLARQWPDFVEAEPTSEEAWIQMSCQPSAGVITVDRYIRNRPEGRGSTDGQLVVDVKVDQAFARWIELYLRLAV